MRDENNRCILVKECPKGMSVFELFKIIILIFSSADKCTGENEYFTDCGSSCGDLRCDLQRFVNFNG